MRLLMYAEKCRLCMALTLLLLRFQQPTSRDEIIPVFTLGLLSNVYDSNQLPATKSLQSSLLGLLTNVYVRRMMLPSLFEAKM